ncbi:MAG TPA: 2Fe-2S iron-sulfur cluster-binding protein [Gammaproteobacteria bacterium]
MARYITLSKAARLVGVKRGTLQKRIRAGELSTFEGELDVEELLRAYPGTQMEDNTMIERVERFMEEAFAKAMRHESEALDVHTLARRVSLLGQELAAAKTEIHRYNHLMEQIKQAVAGLQGGAEVAAFRSWFVQVLEGDEDQHGYPRELLDKETFLRILAAHVRVLPSGHDYFVEGAADLLDAGLSAGLSLRYGCSDGSCGRCRGRLVSGEVRQTRTPLYELNEAQRERGELLLCCTTAVTDVVLEAVERHPDEEIQEQRLDTRVRRLRSCGSAMNLVELRPQPGQRLEFRSGQYVWLETGAGRGGEFSLASCPCDASKLELHIPHAAGDPAAGTLGELNTGDSLMVVGPRGRFVLGQDASRPLLMLACDGGFAPIKALIEQAIALDLVESIELYWLDSGEAGQYLDNLCRSWADALDIFEYHPLKGGGEVARRVDLFMDALRRDGVDLAGMEIYAAGRQELLPALHEALLEAGAEEKHLHLEPLRQGEPVASSSP